MIQFQDLQNELFYYISEPISSKIAIFDIDWTVTYCLKRYPSSCDENDVKLIPFRRNKILDLFNQGYSLLFITNQTARTQKEKQKKLNRISNFVKILGIPCSVMIATSGRYKKPDITSWEIYRQSISTSQTEITFVGDALGRPQDFSDSDLKFAQQISGCKIYSPDEFFKSPEVDINFSEKEMIILVGAPATGKTTFYHRYLSKYHHISQDILKTLAKVNKMVEKCFKDGISFCLDATNPERNERYIQALEHNFKITVIYLIRDGTGWNLLRGENKVPDIVYHVFFKKLEEPTENNVPGRLIIIT